MDDFIIPFKPGAGHMPPYLAGRDLELQETRDNPRIYAELTHLHRIILKLFQQYNDTHLFRIIKQFNKTRGLIKRRF